MCIARFIRRMSLVGVSVCIAVMLVPVASVSAQSYPLEPGSIALTKALDFLRQVQKPDGDPSEGSIGGYNVSGWVVMAIAAAGEDPHNWNAGGDSIVTYLQKRAGDYVAPDKATDYERMLMAIVAAGENPRSFGGVNYVDGLLNLYDGTQLGIATTLNDDSWGILALVAARGSPEVIQSVKQFLLSKQNTDGGWGLAVGQASDVDNTASAILALVAAGEDAGSQPVTKALAYMKSQQQSNGGFASVWGGANVGSTTWAISAMVAAGQSPVSEQWSQSGNTSVSYLLSLQGADGAFPWSAGQRTNLEWMTAYAISALLGKPYPFIPVIRGDVNDDGLAGDDDIVEITGIIVHVEAANPRADVNGDGSVDALDITEVERIMAGVS